MSNWKVNSRPMTIAASFGALFVSPPNYKRFVSDGANQALPGLDLSGLCPVKMSCKWSEASSVAAEGIITTKPRKPVERVRCSVPSSSSGHFSVIWIDAMYVLCCFGIGLPESCL